MAQRRGFSAAAPRKRRGSPNSGSPSPSPFARAARAHLRRMPDFSKLFSPHAKEPPCWAALFAWRREEDFLRLRLESVAARRIAVRLPLLPLRAPLARTSGECRTSQSSSLRQEKSPPKAGHSMAQRRGFEPPDESPPSHDFQSCSLNHSDISAKAVVIVSYSCEKGNCFCASFAKNSREILVFERLLHALPYIGLRSVRPSK